MCVTAGHRLKVLWGRGQGSSATGGGGKAGEKALPPVPGLPAGKGEVPLFLSYTVRLFVFPSSPSF